MLRPWEFTVQQTTSRAVDHGMLSSMDDKTKRNISMMAIFSKGFERLVSYLNGIGTCAIFGLMLIINADVFGRELFSKPINGIPEIVRLSIVGIVFLQGAHTLAAGRMTHSEMLLNALQRKAPAIAVGLRVLFSLIGACLFAIICYGTWPQLVKSWIRNDYIGSAGIFTAPVWPINAIILMGSGLMAIQYLIIVYRLIVDNETKKEGMSASYVD